MSNLENNIENNIEFDLAQEDKNIFARTELMLGTESVNDLKNKKVVVIGLGGVGGFVVEGLARTAIQNLIICDNDFVAPSNINRQVIATQASIGRHKTELVEERVKSINPDCKVTSYYTYINADNIDEIIPKDADFVVDAIDTVTSKIAIAEYCTKHKIPFIMSLGMGNKIDPTLINITDLYKTYNDPLGKVMRTELKKRRIKKATVCFSPELPIKPKVDTVVLPKEQTNANKRRQTPSSIAFVPSVAGLCISSHVIRKLSGFNKY